MTELVDKNQEPESDASPPLTQLLCGVCLRDLYVMSVSYEEAKKEAQRIIDEDLPEEHIPHANCTDTALLQHAKFRIADRMIQERAT